MSLRIKYIVFASHIPSVWQVLRKQLTRLILHLHQFNYRAHFFDCKSNWNTLKILIVSHRCQHPHILHWLNQHLYTDNWLTNNIRQRHILTFQPYIMRIDWLNNLSAKVIRSAAVYDEGGMILRAARGSAHHKCIHAFIQLNDIDESM